MIKPNDKVWYFDNRIKGNIKTGIVSKIVEESYYHNLFVTTYLLVSGEELSSNYFVFDNENKAIEAYNCRIDYLIEDENFAITEHENKIKELMNKKIVKNI